MIQLLFSLRFQTQLRRTRTELVSSLEKAVIKAVEASGAKVRSEHRYISASFDEDTIGFWLDVLLALEAILDALAEATSELYGNVCILGRNIADGGMALLRLFPPNSGGTGIWCSGEIREALEPYVVFEEPLVEGIGWKEKNGSPAVQYGQLKSLKPFTGGIKKYPFSEKIQFAIAQSSSRNVVLLGPDFIGKREGLYQFCRNALGDFPPLIIRFGSGGTGLSCFTDALGAPIRSLAGEAGKELVLDELDDMGNCIFKERLNDEFSAFVIEKTRRFFAMLLDIYFSAAKIRGITPIVILENIHLANPAAGQIFVDAHGADQIPAGSLVFGTCAVANGADRPDRIPSPDGDPKPVLGFWETVFDRVLRFSPEDFPALTPPELPYDLWEIAYLMALLRRYFPPALFFRLLEEEGKNSAMVSRALDMLSAQGVIDFAEDPQPRIYDFFNTAEEHLNAGLFGAQARIRSLVRNRLLAWVSAGKLRPSFNLLQILADMGAIGSDELILDAVRKDLINGTGASLSAAVNGSLLEEATGTAHLPALLFIIKTLDKLLRGDEEAVRSAFRPPPPEEEGFIYKVQILANMASYQLGIHDPAAALDLVKQSMLISQRLPNGRGLAQVYRLFSLVHLSKGQLEDSIDYSNFALEHAEKFQDFDEFILAAYYAAGAQFLFGNIAHAERLALRAEETALYAGLPDWANRSRFLRGKFCFESGRYEDAQKILKALLDNPYGPLSPEAENTLCAWIYRSAVFLQAERPRKPQRLTGDAFLFAIEDSYLAEDYHRTVGLSTAHLEELQDREFRFIERPDWQSGFAQEEFFLFPRKEFLSRMISVYRALALSQIGGSGREEALQSIQRIVLDGRLSDTDPNGAFYFYAHYRILGESGAPEVDMNTAISMAFKRLQRRASRIDDVEINRTFLSQHYWNSSLSLAAKEHKLI